jgi:hypothetical protein
MRRRSIWCTIWILGALLVVASLDAIPDPPALDPHTVTVKVPAPSELAENLGGHSENVSSLNAIAQSQTPGTVFIEATKPDCPSDVIAQTGQAADPSPPALAGLRYL